MDASQVVASASTIVTAGLELIRDWSLPLLGAFAGVGVISMALIQAVKDIAPIRNRFQRNAVGSWIDSRGDARARQDLIQLAAGGDAHALYELPTSGLMGQLTMASRIALLFPFDYRQVLLALAGSVSQSDVELLVEDSRKKDQGPEADPEAIAVRQAERERVDHARVRVGHMIERNLDALQVSVSSRWEWWNKLAAFVVSALVTSAAFWVYFSTTEQTAQSRISVVAVAALVSVLAGFVAPVAKDLVSALQKIGKS